VLATQAKLSGSDSVLINMAIPVFCKPTTLLNTSPLILRWAMAIMSIFLTRSAYVGALTLLATVEAGPESYGQYLESGEISALSPYVMSDEGAEMQKLWERRWRRVLSPERLSIFRAFTVDSLHYP
jgi:hypothetical protein